MEQSFKTILVLPLLLLFIAVGVYFNTTEPVINNSKQCQPDETLTCQFNLTNQLAQQVIVKFVKKVQVEEQNEVILTLPPDAMVENIWIQGVNMYMGKIAVFELPTTGLTAHNVRHLQFFLGACSEANMRWQLLIQIKKVSEQSETFFVNFQTNTP